MTTQVPNTAVPALEIDPEHLPRDSDSSFGEDVSDELSVFTTSLSPSVTNYPTEHGRRYHAFRPGVYILPNDEAELDRLDITHFLITKGTGDKLFHAPIPQNVQRVLDVGTGTGIWAIEMGDLYPGAEILGNDLSPVQPSWVPPNVKFEVDDIEDTWSHPIPFDFIFCRYMATSILDWPRLVRNIYNNTKPGGWAEFQDFDLQYYSDDDSLKPEHETLRWINVLLDASRHNGRNPCPGPLLEQLVRGVGFTNVHHEKFKLPIGPWAKDKKKKEVGLFNLVQILDGLEGFSLRLFTNVLGWELEEVQVMLAKVRSELKSKAIHAQFDIHIAYGQRPSILEANA
ncbi:S-adenosyl-L-methionine-dependent methyltransferase [Glonium stellatum]|uniref:S-adenosyl-L-methionine-dependent methyltransferase n=1 Tax=Glonium stellatum TaxID=574774 RepID=A0A8E2EY24_9PEZI|nr:S-adenosyl-L-methionine-dependent methyltransferase [Glonium stellatum]